MSEKRNAFYYRERYYLLPQSFTSIKELRSEIIDLPARIRLQVLSEDNHIRSNIEKGVSIAPYFYSEYGFAEEEVLIEDLSDVYPVEVELFKQAEYNERLRKVILEHCPGCLRYKPISNRVQSLNRHFEEISLNAVCFFRQDSKPSPRVFRSNLFALSGLWKHFDPGIQDAERVTELIKSMIHLKFDAARKDDQDPRKMTVAFKSNFFVKILADTLKCYIENALPFTEFIIQFDQQTPISKEEFEKQISKANRDSLQINCKRYGVSLAKLSFDPLCKEKVARSLKQLLDHYYFVELLTDSEAVYLLLLDECQFMKELRFRAPVFEAAKAEIIVYNQYNETKYHISFDMYKHILE